MSRSLGDRPVLYLAVAAVMAAAPRASFATMSVPEGSGIVAMGVHPPKTGEGRPLVEHLPLKNHLNLEVQFRTTSTPVTVTGGSVEDFDADGNNAKPGPTHPELCDENGQPAGCKYFCGCGGVDIGVDPPTFDNCLYGSGNTLIIDHGNGEYSWYAHMQNGSNSGLSLGDVVTRGQVAGRVGNSGASGGHHLHFALMNGPDPECSDNVPLYASNIAFISPGHFIPRRQLDVSLRTPTILTDILPASTPLSANQPIQGNKRSEQVQ